MLKQTNQDQKGENAHSKIKSPGLHLLHILASLTYTPFPWIGLDCFGCQQQQKDLQRLGKSS